MPAESPFHIMRFQRMARAQSRPLLDAAFAEAADAALKEVARQIFETPTGADIDAFGAGLWWLANLADHLGVDLQLANTDPPSAASNTDTATLSALQLSLGHIDNHGASKQDAERFRRSTHDLVAAYRAALQAGEARHLQPIEPVAQCLSALFREATRRKISMTSAAWRGLAIAQQSAWHRPAARRSLRPAERFARHITANFRSLIDENNEPAVQLYIDGVRIGATLTDKRISDEEPPGFRFHDAAHICFMIHLGWSPVLRELLNKRRKHQPVLDKADNARARITEEELVQIFFDDAVNHDFYKGKTQVSARLLRTIYETTKHFPDLAKVDAGAWEQTALDAARIWNRLIQENGGWVSFACGQPSRWYSNQPKHSMSAEMTASL